MPTQYTITTGAQPKLLATTDGTTRTVTALRGLTAREATDLAESLTELACRLVVDTAQPEEFTAQATRLGVRAGQVYADGRYTLTVLADQPPPAAPVRRGPDTWRVYPLARTLELAGLLPDAAQRSLRTELKQILGAFDGPVAVAEVNQVEGAPVTVHLGPWLADPDQSQFVHDLLVVGWPDCAQATEQVAWYYSAPGWALERTAHELVAAEWDIEVSLDLDAVVDRLAVTQPGYLAELVRLDTEHGDDGLDPEQQQALDRARALLTDTTG